jgi:SAM-dependent methyltransferase
VTVPVEQGRVRAYPGLSSSAPSTLPFYRAFAGAFAKPACILDAGCGAGTGSAILATFGERVIGVDRDPKALSFAREYATDVDYVLSSFDEPIDGVRADAAVVADVLGHTDDPARFLASLRGSLESRARVLVAEPQAFVAQRLAPPARRAFSRRSLQSLLVRGGFRATAWVADTGTFLACMASAADCASTAYFVEATRLSKHDVEGACAALRAAGKSGQRDVQREAALAEAELHVQRGNGDEAARTYIRAAEVDGADPRAFAGLALLALAAGSVSDAMELATRAAQIDATEPMAAIAVASTLDRMSAQDAFDAWRIAERLAPSELGIATRVAALAADRGDYAFGIAVFERLRAYGDKLPMDFHVTLALLLLAEGRRADALLELRLARTIDPHHPAVSELWSELHADAS